MIGQSLLFRYWIFTKNWSSDQLSRPKFEEIANELRFNQNYITEKVNVKEFKDYVDCIDIYQITFNETKVVISNNLQKNKDENKIINDQLSILLKFPEKRIDRINDKYKVGRYLIEGLYDYPVDTTIGWRFIKNSIKNGCKKSLVYYIKHLIKGKTLPQNMKKARKSIEKLNSKGDEVIYYNLIGRSIQANTELAIKYFEDAIEKGSALSMNEYANMLCHGKGVPIDYDLATKYFKMAIDKGYARAMNYYSYMIEHMEEVPPDYDSSLEYFKMAVEHSDDDIYSNLFLKYF